MASIALALVTPAAAQNEAPTDEAVNKPVIDDSTERCISVRSIKRTEIIDDRNVLFHMRRKVVYHNILSHRCVGLAREGRMSYKTSSGRLCDNDSISVLQRDSFGLRAGIQCGLGMFHKMSREDAEALKEGSGKPPPSRPLPMPKPQEVGDAENDPE